VASEILSSIPNSVGQEASFPLGKMWSGGASKNPQARPCANKW
jgi:hypothetical protein